MAVNILPPSPMQNDQKDQVELRKAFNDLVQSFNRQFNELISNYSKEINTQNINTEKVLINTSGVDEVPVPTGTMLHLQQKELVMPNVVIDGYGVGGVPSIIGRHPEGTPLAPSATASGRSLININGRGHNGISYTTPNSGLLAALATETWTTSANGSKWIFQTTQNGGVTPATVLTVDHNGDVYSATFADYSATSTIVGWSSFTDKYIQYKLIGKTCFVYVLLNGVSNSTNTSITLPYNNGLAFMVAPISQINNNSTPEACGDVYMTSGSNIAYFRRTLQNGTWTASGTKTVVGQFNYQIA